MKNVERQPESSEELMQRTGDDPEAFVQLYRRDYDDIFRYCVHRLFERLMAAETVPAYDKRLLKNAPASLGIRSDGAIE